MKKLYLLLGLLYVGLLAMPATANQPGTEITLLRASGAAITRKGNDTLMFLGQPYFLVEADKDVSIYALNGEKNSKNGIIIKKYTNEQAPSLNYDREGGTTIVNGHRQIVPPVRDPHVVTRDLRNPNDQIASWLYEFEEEDGPNFFSYQVKRKIQGKENTFLLVVIVEDSDDVKIQQKVFQTVRNTPAKVVEEAFVETDERCVFGADCRK